MITFTQKEFTSYDLAYKHSGLLEEAISHILKIKFGFDYERDGEIHKDDIWNKFLKKSFEQSKKRKNLVNKYYDIYKEYQEKFLKFNKLYNSINNDFRNHYKLKRNLKKEELEEALDILGYIMNSSSEKEIKDKISKLEPWRKS